MLVAKYNDFVQQTDQYKEKPKQNRYAIALYGLVGEVGSLISAVKKNLLAEDGQRGWNQYNDEITEEIGDVIWYCFSLAQIANTDRPVNIFTNDIALLKREIGGDNERARKIHAALDPSKKDTFLQAAEHFPNTEHMKFSDYQRLAFLTARTEGQELMEVCLAVLSQLGAEILRTTLPEVELTLNTNVADRPVNVVLGEIAWHLAAVASLYHLSMDDIADRNVTKVHFRSDRSQKTPLHDEARDSSEQFPRHFRVAFVSVGRGRARMYLEGKRLGDELTDNSYDDDGYRFHDVMHLANATYLGWSPVLRKLLGRKRKSEKKIDEVEDGQRAAIVEELVLKAIHTEGNKAAKESGGKTAVGPFRHFPARKAITFRLLKSLRQFVEGLEVEKNKFWEWEDAIFVGADVFHKLHKEQQGTVTVDLENRQLTFSPEVCIDLKGVVTGLGSASATLTEQLDDTKALLSDIEYCALSESDSPIALANLISAKRAILNALGIWNATSAEFQLMSIKIIDSNRVHVKALGSVLEKIWSTNTLAFRVTFTHMPTVIMCTAIGIGDAGDKS